MEHTGSEGRFGRRIIQYPADYSMCAGCGSCEAVCGLTHDGVTGPLVKRLFLERDTTMTDDMHKIYACLQCLDHPCYDACPKKEKAMKMDSESGVVYIDRDECTGCGLCYKACPFEPKRISLHPDKPHKALKCDLCRTRPEGPACVEYCQVRCIGLSDAARVSEDNRSHEQSPVSPSLRVHREAVLKRSSACGGDSRPRQPKAIQAPFSLTTVYPHTDDKETSDEGFHAPKGYAGRIARINLTDCTVSDVPTSNYVPKYIGGRGVCNKIFWDEVGPGVGAFDPENKLIFMTGPTTSTGVPTGGRATMCGISPNNLPEQYCWSGIGGWFGTMLKFAGYDGFILEGKAAKPTYIFIDDDKITFHPADELWGRVVHETQKKLESLLGRDINSIVIGPAGENLVRNASVTTSNDSVAAKAGFGAVFGSKNLKAISVRGTGKVTPAKIDMVLDLQKTLGKPLYEPRPIKYKDRFDPRPHINFPVPGGVKEGRVACSYGCNQHCNLILLDVKAGIGGNESGRTNIVNKCVGIYAYQMMEDSGWTPQMSFNTPENDYNGCRFISGDGFTADLSDPAIKEGLLTRRYGDTLNYWDGDYDRGNIINDLCTQYGIDRWDVVIWYMSWLAMGKAEGVLDDIDFGLGMEIDPGNAEFMRRFLEMIVYRKGKYGEIFAEGMARAIRALGMDKYGKTIYKGRTSVRTGEKNMIPISLESAWGHCCHWAGRGFQGSNDIACWLPIAIELMTATRDAQTNTHHHDSWEWFMEVRDDPYHNPRVAESIIRNEHSSELKESLMGCEFQLPTVFDDDTEAIMFEAATGVKITPEEMYLSAERMKNLFRAILIRNYGRTRELEVKEVYPILTYPDADGKTAGWEDFNHLVDMYYEQRGWDNKTGWPTRATYEKLGLGDVADELYKIGKLP